MLTFQLLSKDGSSLDDAEGLSGRWQAYVEGFVSETETPGVPASKVRRPFLRRYVFFPLSLLFLRAKNPRALDRCPRPPPEPTDMDKDMDKTFMRAEGSRSRSACARIACFMCRARR